MKISLTKHQPKQNPNCKQWPHNPPWCGCPA